MVTLVRNNEPLILLTSLRANQHHSPTFHCLTLTQSGPIRPTPPLSNPNPLRTNQNGGETLPYVGMTTRDTTLANHGSLYFLQAAHMTMAITVIRWF